MRVLKISALVLGLWSAAPALAARPEWTIRRAEWSATDEKNFGVFISAIANSKCHTVDSCLKSAANPYRASDDPRWTFTSDCGRFPYLMRTYFAWKNGLPMSVESAVAAVNGVAPRGLRYSPRGNYVTRRLDLVPQSGRRLNGMNAIAAVMSVVNTAMYRYDAEKDQGGNKFYDFAPARLNRESIHPGSVVYDANGHAALVSRVGDDGRIFLLDAHPGNLVTRPVYSEKFARSSPQSGAGFKNFRPLKLVGATRDANGNYVGGHITAVSMSSRPDYSMEQYYGTTRAANWRNARFVKNGQTLDYYDYVRTVMAVGDLKYEPVIEMQNAMSDICNDLQDRVIAVEDSISHKLQNKPQPYALPDNIYGTDGEWEEYSSPSRDARLKTSFVEIRRNIQKYVELFNQGSPRVVYTGSDLAGDLRNAYESSSNACVIRYSRTDGSVAQMTYSHIALRLFSLSFDPYQCIERRWGATDPAELSTCRDDQTKHAWYEAEQHLRNQIERPYDQKMNFTLSDLRNEKPGTGPANPPDVDLRGYLYSL